MKRKPDAKRSIEPVARFLRFNLVGLLNTATDAIVFTMLAAYAGLHYLPSGIISYGCGMLNSYIWNSLWTFRTGFSLRTVRSLRFAIANLLSLIASLIALAVLKDLARLPLFAAKTGSIVVSVILNFIMSSRWVFRKEEPEIP